MRTLAWAVRGVPVNVRTVPLAVERWYDFPEIGGYLGNVGSTVCTRAIGLRPAERSFLFINSNDYNRCMWNSLTEFIRTVFRYWWALVPGVIFGGIGLWEWMTQRPLSLPVPVWLRITIVVAALFVATFLAFHKVRAERDAVGNRKTEAIDGLAHLLALGSQIYHTEVCSDDELDAWYSELKKWRRDTGTYLREFFSEAECLSFRNPGSPLAASIPGSRGNAHNSKRLILNVQIENLRDIINVTRRD
jgi:hypothetical protein